MISRAIDNSILIWLWRKRLTMAGKVWLACVMVSGLSGLITTSVPVYHLFLATLVFYSVFHFVSMVFSPGLSISASVPDKAVAGRTIVAELTLGNTRRFPAFDIGLGGDGPRVLEFTPPGSVDCIEPGSGAVARMRIRPLRRGFHGPFEIDVFSTFPFALRRTFADTLVVERLVVYPAFSPVIGVDMPYSHRHQPGGIAYTSKVGESPEYIGSRDYRPGDPIRRMDHRSWARLGAPAVREFQEEYFSRIAIFLDTFLTGNAPLPETGHRGLEAAVSLTASLADAVCRDEHVIDLFAAGKELFVFKSGRHISHFDSVMEILACIEPVRENPYSAIAPTMSVELASISVVLFVFLGWTPEREAIVTEAVEAGCSVRVWVVEDSAADGRGGQTSPGPGSDLRAETVSGIEITRFSPADIEAGNLGVL